MTDEQATRLHSELHLIRLFLGALVRIEAAEDEHDRVKARRDARRLFGDTDSNVKSIWQ